MGMEMPTEARVYEEKESTSEQKVQPHGWKWTPGRIYHWVLSFTIAAYVMWRYASNEYSTFLVEQMSHAFRESPYGLQRKQDVMNWGWQTTKYVMMNAWKWYLLHPVLGRLTAYAAPSLVPVFYAVYSSLFVAFNFGWEVTLLYLGQHAALYAAAALRIPVLCYAVAIVIHCQKFVLPFEPFEYMFPRYGLMPYRAAFVAFHWNIMRGLSFSLDFVKSERQKQGEESSRRWPPYWQSLAYVIYLPTMYLGPPQNYDDYVIQLNKTRPSCTPMVIAGAIARLLRSGAHFFLMEFMGHFFYRYFDRGMHKWIRRYIYEPVVGGGRRAHRLVLGTAVAFTFTWVWHSMHGHDGIWCALSVLGIVLEVITIEVMKWTPVKKFQGRYLASAERMREAKALLGSPHFLLTICACIFHLAELDVCLVIVRRILTGFPFPLVPILMVLYSASHVSMDVADWEAAAVARQKQAAA